jgi:hypothetical protein
VAKLPVRGRFPGDRGEALSKRLGLPEKEVFDVATAIAPERVRECLDACTECIEACEACARHCIEAAEREMVECTKLCLDCSALCTACIPLLARDSRYYGALCGLCADACDACAEERERFDDDIMLQCAESCRRAAEQCRRLAA